MGWIKFFGNSLLGVFFMFVLIIVPYNPKPKLFSVETVVETKMPPKVSFFIWTATLGKLLTIDNLRR